ncbi:MAG: TIGR04438 family Trp-rich protein [Burkholderiaceae bacterium]|nr:TIGR04438 family Trp-rich protein [Burkholderiaceae bacterium]
MWLILVGVLLLVMKVGEFSPVAGWSWIWVLMPFGLAVLWWAWADKVGYTQKQEMKKLDERKDARRNKSLEALGIDTTKRKRK